MTVAEPDGQACVYTLVALSFLMLAACSSDSTTPPVLEAPPTTAPVPEVPPTTSPVLEAVASDSSVELSWQEVPRATYYTLFWSTTRERVFSDNEITIGSSPFVHSGLANLTTYYYAIAAGNSDGTGPPSEIVAAEPGPVPMTTPWAVVVTEGMENVIHWPNDLLADGFRVYWAEDHETLQSRTPGTSFVDVAASPLRQPRPADGRVIYYRVDGRNGSRRVPGGYVAHSTVFQQLNAGASPRITASLWDIDGDGCLDTVGSRGRCDGTFEPADFAQQGTAALMSPGRTNRDSRFADFTDDGRVDIFTNVYSRADDPASYALMHVNQGDGTFLEDPAITSLRIGGFGETVLAADFNNDGAIDLFLPHYGHLNDGGRHWLLINDGSGGFRDIAEAAGVVRNPTEWPYVPEAAQALDFNEDGWIDIFVASQLFINNGDLTFVDRGEQYNLPLRFDEGAKFVDVDLDGDLDFVHHDSVETKIHYSEGGAFGPGLTFNAGTTNPQTGDFGFGMNACDVNDDGFEDIVVARNTHGQATGMPRLFLNVNGELRRTEFAEGYAQYNDLIACADLNNDDAQDLMIRGNAFTTFLNLSTIRRTITVRVLDRLGRQNQQGRIVRIRAMMAPDRLQTRVVEGGSGYMAQGGYDLIVATPWPGGYEVSVRFPHGWVNAQAFVGDRVVIREDRSRTFPRR